MTQPMCRRPNLQCAAAIIRHPMAKQMIEVLLSERFSSQRVMPRNAIFTRMTRLTRTLFPFMPACNHFPEEEYSAHQA